MNAVQLCNTNSSLPVRNFREGVIDWAENIDGNAIGEMKMIKKAALTATCHVEI